MIATYHFCQTVLIYHSIFSFSDGPKHPGIMQFMLLQLLLQVITLQNMQLQQTLLI